MRFRNLSFILALLVAILSCAPINQVGDNPVVVSEPSATPFIADSYPTAEANLDSPNQIISGIDVRIDRAWLDGKQVFADVCYTMPDSSDWTIWKASMRYADVVVLEYGATLLSLQEPGQDGQPGQRCDRLEFYVPPDAEISTVTVSLEALGAYPREEDYCTIYMPKIQQSLNERGISIALACNEVDGKQIMQIISVPDTMSQDEAEQLVYSDEFFTINGPWEFTFDLVK